MNKVKVRCSVCGRPFKTPSLKKTVCPSCEAEAKKAKHQAEAAPVKAAAAPSKSDVDVRAALRAAQENQGQFGAYRPPAPTPPPAPVEAPRAARPVAPGQVRTQPAHHENGAAGRKRPPREAGPRPPRPRREPKPRVVQRPFEPTPEQAIAIRERYVALAQPEFDGIRHQIAGELGLPLKAVKDVIKRLREETRIQSWWERGGGLPSLDNMEKIKALYVPLLPEPEIGVHKKIASELHLTNTSVYQAIGQIRTELELPRYLEREALLEEQTGVAAADEQNSVTAGGDQDSVATGGDQDLVTAGDDRDSVTAGQTAAAE